MRKRKDVTREDVSRGLRQGYRFVLLAEEDIRVPALAMARNGLKRDVIKVRPRGR